MVCLGIAVLAVAVFALREPSGHVSAGPAARSGSSNVAKQSSTPRSTAPSRPRSSAPSSSTASTAPGTDSTGDVAVKNVPLVVLNNTTVQRLAAEAASRFESDGWKVAGTGNLQNDIVSTCAYYDPTDPAARPAAEALQREYPAIKRVKPKFAGLPSGPVVVVLTPDYTAG